MENNEVYQILNGSYSVSDYLLEGAVECSKKLPNSDWNGSEWVVDISAPMRELRAERDRLLSLTDYQALSDIVMTNAQKTYRQELRDLPLNSNPYFDDDGALAGVAFPEVVV
jgi:hypothetical protein